MKQYYSQAHQDMFVTYVLNNKQNGYFVDIGSAHPITISNSYFLEKELGWKGVCIDLQSYDYSSRQAEFINGSALDISYKDLFERMGMPRVIDYISLDIDCPHTLDALKLVMQAEDYEFRVLTVEHDWCRKDERLVYRDEQRRILKSKNYELVCSDLWLEDFGYFEDWWVNPKYIDVKSIKHLQCDKLHPSEVIKKFI